MSHHPATSAAQWRDRVRDSGLRATTGRIEVLSYLEGRPHSSVAEIHATLAGKLPSLSLQSVHNVVHDLSAHGVVRRVDLPDSDAARYETRTDDNHHHVQCLVCGRIEDVDCAVDHAPCLTPAQTHGMRILTAEVTFRGVCADCEERIAEQPPHPTHPATPPNQITTEGTISA